jgi:peptide/nickel transport system permease protein
LGGLLATDLKSLYDQPFGPVVPAALIIGAVCTLNTLADDLRDGGRRRGAVWTDGHAAWGIVP